LNTNAAHLASLSRMSFASAAASLQRVKARTFHPRRQCADAIPSFPSSSRAALAAARLRHGPHAGRTNDSRSKRRDRWRSGSLDTALKWDPRLRDVAAAVAADAHPSSPCVEAMRPCAIRRTLVIRRMRSASVTAAVGEARSNPATEAEARK
jgi:hypothetical protein